MTRFSISKISRVGTACLSAWLVSTFWIAEAHAQESRRNVPAVRSTAGEWVATVLAEDLDYPWSLAHSAGSVLVTEAAGNVVVLEQGRLTRYPLATSDAIAREGGAGLLGMALSPDYPTSGVAYFYHTYKSNTGLTNKVIEARFDGRAWHETRTLLAGIPGHRLYNGGRVAIGPDGLLYVTTGWTEDHDRPQDLKSLAGKVLRMTKDGKIPQGNPFTGSYVYSYGHRNPQGLAWNRAGQLFEVEHGQSAHDEINLIKPGANYGWPLAEGDAQRDGFEPAWLESGRDTWAPSGATFFHDQLLVAALGARGLYAVDPATRYWRPAFSSGDRIRDVMAVDERLYLVTTNRSPRADGPSKDRLIRLSLKR